MKLIHSQGPSVIGHLLESLYVKCSKLNKKKMENLPCQALQYSTFKSFTILVIDSSISILCIIQKYILL